MGRGGLGPPLPSAPGITGSEILETLSGNCVTVLLSCWFGNRARPIVLDSHPCGFHQLAGVTRQDQSFFELGFGADYPKNLQSPGSEVEYVGCFNKSRSQTTKFFVHISATLLVGRAFPIRVESVDCNARDVATELLMSADSHHATPVPIRGLLAVMLDVVERNEPIAVDDDGLITASSATGWPCRSKAIRGRFHRVIMGDRCTRGLPSLPATARGINGAGRCAKGWKRSRSSNRQTRIAVMHAAADSLRCSMYAHLHSVCRFPPPTDRRLRRGRTLVPPATIRS